MPKLQKFREYHYEATVQVSNNTRTFALAAIAIVWLFKTEVHNQISVPDDLKTPLFLVVIALALDFLQHVYRSVAWQIVFRCEEKKFGENEIDEKKELHVTPWVNTFAYVLFYIKVCVLIVAYYELGSYFLKIVNWG